MIDRAEARYANRVLIGAGLVGIKNLPINFLRQITETEEEANEQAAIGQEFDGAMNAATPGMYDAG